MSVNAAHAVVQQNVRGSRRSRSAVGADHAVGCERHFELLGFEPFVQEFGGALREDFHQAHDLGFRQSPQAPEQFQVVDKVAGSGGRKVRRRGEKERLGDHGEAFETMFILGIRLRIPRRELGDLSKCFRRILPHEKMTAIGERGEEGRILGIHVISEALQLQIAHDFFLHQAGEVGSGGDAISRPDFLGDGTSADEFTRFQDDYAPPGARKIRSGDQSVMAASDNDCVIRIAHHRL